MSKSTRSAPPKSIIQRPRKTPKQDAFDVNQGERAPAATAMKETLMVEEEEEEEIMVVIMVDANDGGGASPVHCS